jgi:hypothetical protein
LSFCCRFPCLRFSSASKVLSFTSPPPLQHFFVPLSLFPERTVLSSHRRFLRRRKRKVNEFEWTDLESVFSSCLTINPILLTGRR